jgi:GntR family transcriptional regulator
MALWIQITAGSNKPVYKQIVEQISEAIAKGQVRPSDKLPPVRKLAAELVINPNTVARSYTILEQTGLVNTRTGSGTYVSNPAMRSGSAADTNALAERMDNIIVRGLNLGLNKQQLLEMFEKRFAGFNKEQKDRGEPR